MDTFLYEYCGKPDLSGLRHKKRNYALAVMARSIFKERTGMTAEEFLRRKPDHSGWLQDGIIARAIADHDPLT